MTLPDVTGIVLAGGSSTRFGRDKAFEHLENRSLIQTVVDRLRSMVTEVLVVTSLRLLPELETLRLNARVVTDIQPGCGPLGGLHTGLSAMKTEHGFMVGCDMPFLNQALAAYMANLIQQYDVVLPRIGEFREPLHAFYSRTCLAAAEQRLKEGDVSIYGMLGELRVRYVEAEEIDRFDPEHRSFFNVNRKTDIEIAREIAVEIRNTRVEIRNDLK